MCNQRNTNVSINSGACNSGDIENVLEAAFENDALIIKLGAELKAKLELCNYSEDVIEFECNNIVLAANSSRDLVVSGDTYKMIAVRVLYDTTAALEEQFVAYDMNRYLINPITKLLVDATDHIPDVADYSLFLPTADISLSDTVDIGDKIIISGVELSASVDFAIGLTPLDTANNIIAAIALNTTLEPHVQASYSAPNIIIEGKYPLMSYHSIKVEYTPVGGSTNAVVGSEFLTNDITFDDSKNVIGEFAMINNPAEQPIRTFKVYNLTTKAITLKILKFR
jgi:hypothetical protein